MAFLTEVAQYTCYRTAGPITIDGRLDEPSWRRAPPSTPFVDIVTGEPAWFDTRVRLLWDDEALYFGFSAQETDVRATLTARDSKIWEENDLEIFVAAEDVYYEFEMNALNTIYEVFWIWKDALRPGRAWYGRPEFDPQIQRTLVLDGVGGHVHPRGERWGFLDWDFPGLRHAVHIDGTLNDASDSDRGWSAEIALPWDGFALFADGRPLPPQDGDVWRIDCSRFEKAGRNGEILDPCAGWTWNRHGHYDSHIPEVFPRVTFSTRSVVQTG
jgi:Carbohydrate-binding family 9